MVNVMRWICGAHTNEIERNSCHLMESMKRPNYIACTHVDIHGFDDLNTQYICICVSTMFDDDCKVELNCCPNSKVRVIWTHFIVRCGFLQKKHVIFWLLRYRLSNIHQKHFVWWIEVERWLHRKLYVSV